MLKKIMLLSTQFFVPHVFSNTWSYGVAQLVESYSDYVLVQYNGPNSESCSKKAVKMSVSSLGNENALERGYSASLSALVSGKPIRLYLTGCDGPYQKATIVQLCANSDCSY